MKLYLYFLLLCRAARCTQILGHTTGVDEIANHENDTVLSQFLGWFRSLGGVLHNSLMLSNIEGLGYGLKVVGPDITISENTVILEIPSSLHITPEKAKEHLSQYNAKRHLLVDMSEKSILAFYLMVERCSQNESGFFGPYVDLLMKGQVGDIPILESFSQDELLLLEDPGLLQIAKQQASTRINEWTFAILPWLKLVAVQSHNSNLSLLSSSCTTFQHYQHAFAVISSHASIQESGEIALIPMADMINHSHRAGSDVALNGFHAHHYFRRHEGAKKPSYVVTTDRAIDGIVWEEYNRLDNSIFLLNFGFCPTDNPYHCVMLEFPSYAEPACIGYQGQILYHEEENGVCLSASLIRQAAKRALLSKARSLDEDYASLLHHETHSHGDSGRPQLILAIRSAMEDKKLLMHLSEIETTECKT